MKKQQRNHLKQAQTLASTWKIVMEGVPALPSGLVNFIIDDKGKVSEMQIDIPNPDFYFDELEFLKVK